MNHHWSFFSLQSQMQVLSKAYFQYNTLLIILLYNTIQTQHWIYHRCKFFPRLTSFIQHLNIQ
jgi:hypothetical protein